MVDLNDGNERLLGKCTFCHSDIYSYPEGTSYYLNSEVWYHNYSMDRKCDPGNHRSKYAKPYSKEERIKAILRVIDEV